MAIRGEAARCRSWHRLARLPGLLLALILGGCASAPEARRSLEVPPPLTHALLGTVPANAVSALYVNHARLRTDWKANLDAGEPPEARRRRQGFVESEDVDHAVVAALGESPALQNLAVYEGRFSDEGLSVSQLGLRGQREPYRGRALWGDEAQALGRLSRERVALGPALAVQSSIDVAADAAPALPSERWFKEAHTAVAQRWPAGQAVSAELLALGTSEMRERMRAFFPEAAELGWLAARAGGGDDLRLVAVASMPNEDAARALVMSLAAQVEALSQRRQMRVLGLSGVLEALQFEASGPLAEVRLSIASGDWKHLRARFAQILEFMRKRQAGAPPQP